MNTSITNTSKKKTLLTATLLVVCLVGFTSPVSAGIGGVVVNKEVTNSHGGSLTADDFTLYIDGVQVQNGIITEDLGDNSVTVSEDAVDGYEHTGTVCVYDKEPTVDLGTTFFVEVEFFYTCTSHSIDIAPTLTVIKDVTNDDNGVMTAADFNLYINGDSIASGNTTSVVAGTEYTISEDIVDGYTQTAITCLDANGTEVKHPVTLALGEDVTCTVYNDDIETTTSAVLGVATDQQVLANTGIGAWVQALLGVSMFSLALTIALVSKEDNVQLQ